MHYRQIYSPLFGPLFSLPALKRFSSTKLELELEGPGGGVDDSGRVDKKLMASCALCIWLQESSLRSITQHCTKDDCTKGDCTKLMTTAQKATAQMTTAQKATAKMTTAQKATAQMMTAQKATAHEETVLSTAS